MQILYPACRLCQENCSCQSESRKEHFLHFKVNAKVQCGKYSLFSFSLQEKVAPAVRDSRTIKKRVYKKVKRTPEQKKALRAKPSVPKPVKEKKAAPKAAAKK